jgi:hypothetical protein
MQGILGVHFVERDRQYCAYHKRTEACRQEQNDIHPREFPGPDFTDEGNGRVETTIHETLTPGLEELERLEIFTRLKADSLSRRNVNLRARAWVPTNPGLARLDRKNPKAPQLNAIVGLQSVLHAVKDGIDRLLGFGLADARALNDLINKIQFDHWQTS